jgi:hypothetical protein
MPGTAKTSSFMLSTATVMIGPKANLHSLTVADHSIGLVKNFTLTSDPAYVELTQGLRNSVVMSVRNSDGLKASMEVYEFTPSNLAYAAGLDGSVASFAPMQSLLTLFSAVASGATTAVVAGDQTGAGKLAVGDYIFLQSGQTDVIHIAKISAIAYAAPNTTITFAAFPVPTGVSFAVGDRLGEVSRIDIGGQTNQGDYGAKIVGLLPKDNTPFTILLPKVKITRGLSVAFASDNFSNMPFEMSPYSMTAADPFYADYGDAVAVLFPR